MKIKTIVQLLSLASLFLFVACEQEKEPILVTGVTISQTTLELTEGDNQTLTVEVLPSNADNKTVSWTSSQAAIASVQNGVVTAHKAGSATIIVTTADGGKIATCEVSVKEKIYSVQSVSLDKSEIDLTEGDEAALTATINPSNATNKNVTWSSSNTEVATVTEGKVSAIKIGKATITVTTADGNKTASCEITVKEKVYSVESVSLDKSEIDLTEGDEAALTATINPSNATNKNVTWSSSNTSVATVADGKIVAVKAGNATITVKTEDGGKTAICKVTVKERIYPVESISLDKTSVELMEGETLTLTATITPHNATNKNMIWMSSDDAIASVDGNGKVTAIKEGIAIITARTEDGDKIATCEINVMHDKLKDPIEFADEIMKEMCVSAFDTNRDGELSYEEAAAVTALSVMKLTDKSVKSFDEFQYFTSVKFIPDDYFSDSNLQSISLPQGVTGIGSWAFSGCYNLKNINLPKGLTSIQPHTFKNCTSLTSLIIPETVTNIGRYAFYGCSKLTTINIPNGITCIEEFTFEKCTSLTSLIIPETVTNIGSYAFYGCSKLTTINIPEAVYSLGEFTFMDCSSLKSVNIPDGVTRIGTQTFCNCSSLTSVIIPEYVTYIGSGAFSRCLSLVRVDLKPLMCPELPMDSLSKYSQFSKHSQDRKIYVPSASLEAYKTAEGWSEYADDIVGYDYQNDKVVE